MSGLNGTAALTRLPEWHFDYAAARQQLLKHFNVHSLAGFGCEDLHPAIAAAGALLEYARKTQGQALSHVNALRPERADDYVRMDAATRRNLELTETLRGTPAPTLCSLLDGCATGMGSRLLRHWLHHPLRDRAVLANRHEAVEELAQAAGTALREALRRIADVERISARIALKSARPRDLSGLRDSLAALPQLAALLARATAPRLAELREGLAVPPEGASLLARAILPEPAALLTRGRRHRSTATTPIWTNCARCRPTRANSWSRSKRASASAPAFPTSRSSTTACTASTSRSPTRMWRRFPPITAGARR